MSKVDEPIPYVPVEVREVWPVDEAFRKFAARIADAVMWAENNGWRVQDRRYNTDAECCPLGACIALRYRVTARDAHKVGGFPVGGFPGPHDEGLFFASGFNGTPCAAKTEASPYYRLGAAYRARALAKHGDA